MAKKPTAKDKTKPKAKAKGRSVKNAAGATETAPVKYEAKQIEKKDFQNLHRRRSSLKKQGKEINSSSGALLTDAANDKNLDKPAYAFYEKLWAMSPQKRLTTLACFDFYREIPHFSTGKKLDEDETGQGALDIPRQEAGETTPKKTAAQLAADRAQATSDKNKAASGTVVDLRPPHLRPVSEGGTKVETDEDQKAAVH